MGGGVKVASTTAATTVLSCMQENILNDMFILKDMLLNPVSAWSVIDLLLELYMIPLPNIL